MDKQSVLPDMNTQYPHIPAGQLARLQDRYFAEMNALLQAFGANTVGQAPVIDRRFSGAAWQSNLLYQMNAALYLLGTRYLEAMADAVQADEKTRKRICFATMQWAAAWAPSNFLSTNPDAQHKLIETQGESLRAGLHYMYADLARGRVSQAKKNAFELGKTLAYTAGGVVFENAFFQLLRYQPLTKTVYQVPLLLIPPCINKYYIFDLQADNSFVRYAVSQGHTVFMVSWRNPDASMRQARWDDYVEQGVIAAIEQVCAMTGQQKINLLGFCIGGALVSTALAVLAARGQHPASSLTLLTTLLDFSEVGLLDAFVDSSVLGGCESMLAQQSQSERGVEMLHGTYLANIFSSLRPNDLIWPYVVNGYLKGEEPAPFDLLYWNEDSTHLPMPMVAWYLRHCYVNNALKQAGTLTVCGERVDLRTILAPVFVYGSYEDHIVPWTSAFACGQILSGPCTFVLGASGHIAGVINPPALKKRAYWRHVSDECVDPDKWLAKAQKISGSWWPEWDQWLVQYAGEGVANEWNADDYPIIEPAPGRYVKERIG
ncbi:MAG: class I poly(R)-hydroxyalkanoic acid synthase [Ottowia sp.]|nr:class I poly(R)-hydroxyalkanoic acid synthase [Ottowia sp.]